MDKEVRATGDKDKEVGCNRATEDKAKEVRCNRATEDRCNTEGRCSKEVPVTEGEGKVQ